MKGIRGSMSMILEPANPARRPLEDDKKLPREPRASMLSPATVKGSRIGEPGTIELGDFKEPFQLELPFDTIVEEETKEESQSDVPKSP